MRLVDVIADSIYFFIVVVVVAGVVMLLLFIVLLASMYTPMFNINIDVVRWGAIMVFTVLGIVLAFVFIYDYASRVIRSGEDEW